MSHHLTGRANREPMVLPADDFRIAVNVPDRAALMVEVRARLDRGEGFALATVNLDHLVKLRADPGFRAVYSAQDIVVADGNPIVWLSWLARRPVRLVPGSDMVLPLARLAAEVGAPLALVGTTAPVLARAAQALVAAAPGLQIALIEAPQMGFDPEGPEARALLERVAGSGARLCLIALGAPKQEALARLGRQLAPQTGFASIGAGLDFIAGAQRRAPALARWLALEWLWRMVGAPRRLALRYARCVLILPEQVLAAWRLRRAG